MLAQHSTVTIDSPLIRIVGIAGGGGSQIHYTGTGCAIVLEGPTAGGDVFQGVLLQDFSVDGSDNPNANSCGIETDEFSVASLENIQVGNFAARGDAGIISTALAYWNERVELRHVFIGNSTVGWLVRAPSGLDQAQATFGYSDVDLYVNIEGNQVAVESVGNANTTAVVAYDSLHIIVNSDSPSGNVCGVFKYSQWVSNTGVWRCDGTFANGFVLDSHTQMSIGGYIYTGGRNRVEQGGILSLTNISGQDGASPPLSVVNNDSKTIVSFPGSGSRSYKLPPTGGTFALSGPNGISAGTISLIDGSNTHVFKIPYNEAPVCVASDSDSAAIVRTVSTMKSVSFKGSGSDLITWMCTPPVN